MISQYDYLYDALGRRNSAANSGQAFSAVVDAFNLYDYNDRNELTQSSRYLGANLADTANPVPAEYRNYDYDPIGNRSQAVEDTLTRTYEPNALNQYEQITSDDGQPTIDDLYYDEDGNLTTQLSGALETTYSYNAENRLIAMEPANPVEGDIKVEFRYDYMGRRVHKTVYSYETGTWSQTCEILFLYDGWNLIEEFKIQNSEFKIQYYVWGLDLSQSLQGAGGIGGLLAAVKPVDPEISTLDLDQDNDIDGIDLGILALNPGQVELWLFSAYLGQTDISSPLVHNYLYDANGNVGQLVNAAQGAIGAHYEYDPFGNIIFKTGSYVDDNPFRFSTKYHDDETGLVYYGYRYYSTKMGRWVSRDPIGEEGSFNLYAFVENNPINLIDLIGLLDARCSDGDCCDLEDITGKLNSHITQEIRKMGSLSAIRDRLGKDKSHSYSEGLTEIDAWIQDLGDTCRKSKGKRSEFGFSFGYAWSSCVKLTCNDKTECIGADKISHFFQQGYMLYELFKGGMFGNDAQDYIDAFSKWTEGLYNYPEKPTKQQRDINNWLNHGGFKFHGMSPGSRYKNKVRGWKNKWGNIKAFGRTISVPAIGDHNANMRGYDFWKRLAKAQDISNYTFNICEHINNLGDIIER